MVRAGGHFLGKWVPSAAVSIEFEMGEGWEVSCGEGMLLKVWSQDHGEDDRSNFHCGKRSCGLCEETICRFS